MAIFIKPGTLSPNMLLFLGASYDHKPDSSIWKNTNLNDPNRANTNTADANKTLSSQVQNVIVNQSLTKVEMPQMGKLTLEEARCAMPVLRLHFLTNAPCGDPHVCCFAGKG
ncbi:hypothetical protein DSO57_1018903 [Entomophthora muscae]|uniref:Uncharacterized protein n=1 Tax=Entomophthora muscae TaxID=34485 RepID=A0ACC2TRQ4_9FUNG|nr:hypothetical protein DSO57_1018903 [Entomophthora muscae]